jgi:hypothetical protein
MRQAKNRLKSERVQTQQPVTARQAARTRRKVQVDLNGSRVVVTVSVPRKRPAGRV